MKKKNLTPINLIFAIFIVLLIIPQTRIIMQVAVNKVKVKLFSPATLDVEDQIQLQPFDYQVSDLNGKSQVIEIGKGKTVFLSYWATWCPPCIAELPSIQKLHVDYGSKIDFVLITQENPEIARQFIESKGYDLPVFTPRMQAPEILYERSIPTNYIIDKSGKIIAKEQGATDWNSKKVREILERLIRP